MTHRHKPASGRHLAVILALAIRASGSAAAAPDIGTLITQLDSANADDRAAAIHALGALGEAAAAAVPKLSKLALDEGWRVSQPAAAALFSVAPAKAVALLEPRLKAEDEQTRSQTVKAVEYVGVAALPLLPALIDVVQGGGDGWMRAAAANSIGQMGAAAVTAVPALCEGLNSPIEHVRRYCAKGLGNIGPPAVAAIPALEAAAARTNDPGHARQAQKSLAKIRAAH